MKEFSVQIRPERSRDIEAIRSVNDKAFGQPAEGRLVDCLRQNCKDTLSLVAVTDGEIVGHILFTPATVESKNDAVSGMALAPMAVLPEFQNQGIGSLLVAKGIKKIKATPCPFIIVLGHPAYYPRFGFERASKHGLKCQWPGIPDEVFMVLILNRSIMSGVTGTAKYRAEFNAAI